MFVNNYKINLSTLATGTTATTINIPVSLEYQLVDQSELIENVFVNVEVEKAINPILDYEKVRFLPLDLNNIHVDKITYNLNLLISGTTNLGAINYASVGFSDDDITYERNNFKETFLNLSFYDTDNPLTQRLINNITVFSEIQDTDLLPDIATQILAFGQVIGVPGQPKPAHMIPLSFVLSNPILNPRGFSEGYYLYDYKDEYKINGFKYLYMRASFKNAKTGKSINLMVDNIPYPIDQLINKLYTRYKLIRLNTGFYYEIDNTYSTNVAYASNNATVSLYQIQSI